MQVDPSRDKDYSFARLCDLKLHVTLKMSVISRSISLISRTSLEGDIPKRSYTDALTNPDLLHVGTRKESELPLALFR